LDGPRSSGNRTSRAVLSRQPQNAPVTRAAPASARQRTSTAGPGVSSAATTSGYGAFRVLNTARPRPFGVAATTFPPLWEYAVLPGTGFRRNGPGASWP